MTKKTTRAKLTMGPLFFNWDEDKRRDFYARIADEAAIDCVYVGEVVCGKREKLMKDLFPQIVERLQRGGKDVVVSTLAMVTSERQRESIERRVQEGFTVEANDVACLHVVQNKPHVIGPFINVFNESARDFVIRGGAKRIVMPIELPGTAIATLAKTKKAETEVFVFGRQPLSVAMRCYHARAHGLRKDSCQIVCSQDPDGLATDTLDGKPLLTVSGSQTLSHDYGVLLNELDALKKMGVSHFRLSPQNVDMIDVAKIYRDALDGKLDPKEALAKLKKVTGTIPFANGFFHSKEGMAFVT
ncbi:MAG: U32 family peptidase [Alphaproteobacteria bacterium]|nr:U32 family peptidase [Alphaproteobacteria bacterium]